MQAEDLGDVHGQRTVHEHVNRRQLAFFPQLVQSVSQFLGAPHGKGGDEQLTSPVVGLLDGLTQHLFGFAGRLVEAVAVGTFHDDEVHVFGHLGVAQNGEPFTPDVAAEEQAELTTSFLHVDDNNGRAQDMPGIAEVNLHTRDRLEGAAVFHRAKVGEGIHGVPTRVEWLKEIPALPGPALVDVGHIAFLDVRRVEQHISVQVACGRRGVDGATEASLDQRGQVAAVVDVRVG